MSLSCRFSTMVTSVLFCPCVGCPGLLAAALVGKQGHSRDLLFLLLLLTLPLFLLLECRSRVCVHVPGVFTAIAMLLGSPHVVFGQGLPLTHCMTLFQASHQALASSVFFLLWAAEQRKGSGAMGHSLAMASEYITYKGVLFPGLLYFPEELSYLEDKFLVWDDDLFIVTSPSQGTNWMLEILSLIRCDGDPGWVLSVLNWDRAPWLESQQWLKSALKYPSPRLLCSHLPSQLFPKSLQRSKAKIIYTLRCPKDVLVSFYHFSKVLHIFKTSESLDSFLEDFLSGNVPFGSWFDHIIGWMGLKGSENFFSITYEELQQDLAGSVRRICHFLGQELSEEQVAAVVENASFESMKGNKMSNFSQVPDNYMDHQQGSLLRKGICGDWRNHLSEAQSQRFDTIYRERMQGLGITFPWD
ncbi:sulfotransferase 2A1-like [Carettochelys insculpta]|uniref:sulfotransferase 2A1-like n=1 Tax=Carettochelys insculpta TaxID=44489 RepID=UPI003EBA7209